MQIILVGHNLGLLAMVFLLFLTLYFYLTKLCTFILP
ncbi:hypothetical protein CHY_2505 [Carboxydothermus hydrogenoformans Z-2901]|uniref:Uncharacterized protein n=1 Tax=Carboxydothermus hydrogenoformans (strain ATCC BAA-161 / DSM 6008 / Z-2901) TaxID=246194 RepID=Q3A985_CARHZ|nr:hypothetical protein CHY_2505 [Carboxydothermus hydrogenoformans Z-2901]